MLRKIVLVSLVLLLAAGPAAAGIINGGFETGDWTGWTKNGGSFDGTYHWTGDPGKSAVVGTGFDYYSNDQLPQVAYGNYAARVNNYDYNYHFSTIEQTVSNWGTGKVFFAWAAVLEEPSNAHPPADAPHFRITLYDVTTSTTLYDVAFNVYQPPLIPGFQWKDGRYTGSQWKYNDWVIQEIAANHGDTLRITVLASDCGWGGHGGYAYVDQFSESQIPPPVPVPSAVLLLGSGLAGLAAWRKFKA